MGVHPFTVGAAVLVVLFVLLPSIRLQRGWARLNWHRCMDDKVYAWAHVTVSGFYACPIRVRSAHGVFRVRPRYGVVYHRERTVPMQGNTLVLIVSDGRRKHRLIVTRDASSCEMEVFGTLKVHVRFPCPEPAICLSDLFERTVLPRGCVVMTDRKASEDARDLLFVVGKGSHVREVGFLDAYRARNFRLHVFHYESHTHARTEKSSDVDCSFPSGELASSLKDLRCVLASRSFVGVVAYSFGGLLVMCHLRRFPTVRTSGIRRLVLLAPFLSFSPTSLRGFDSDVGVAFLRYLKWLLPTDERSGMAFIVPPIAPGKTRRKVNWGDYERWRRPVSDGDPLVTNTDSITWNFVHVASTAIRSLRGMQSVVPSLVVLGKHDHLVDVNATRKTCVEALSDLRVHELETDHDMGIPEDATDLARVLDVIAPFLAKE